MPIKVTVSIGVAVFPLIKMETLAITLLNAADHALYKAKASGCNNVCTCDSRVKKFSRINAVEINENWCQEYAGQADIASQSADDGGQADLHGHERQLFRL